MCLVFVLYAEKSLEIFNRLNTMLCSMSCAGQTRGCGFFFNVIMSFDNDQFFTFWIVRVVVFSLYHLLACDIVSYNLCFQVVMNLLSDYPLTSFIVFNLVVSNIENDILPNLVVHLSY